MPDILNSIDGRYLGLDIDGRLVARDYAETGSGRVVAKKLHSSVAASTAVTNTVTETEFDQSHTLAPNLLKAGSLIRIRYQGIATAQNATDTLTVKLYLGGKTGTALQASAATDVATNAIFGGEFTLCVRTVGASGTMVGFGTYISALAISGTATMVAGVLASTTVDTTVSQRIAAAATWSVANAGNSCRLDFLSVEML